MGDLGDLGDFFKSGSLSNLDWLDIDEEKYRAGEYPSQGPLPHQNLNLVPDLEAIWSHEDRPSTSYFVPNKDLVRPYPDANQVNTMGDLSETHGRLRSQGDDVARVTRYAMMQSVRPEDIRRQLRAHFDQETLRAHGSTIASVLGERGLLGPIYIAASDFPGCQNAPKSATTFARRYAPQARYLVAKLDCSQCLMAKDVGSGLTCSVFHKQIIPEMQYTDDLAERVERDQAALGKAIEASSKALPARDRVRLAVLSKPPSAPKPVYAGVGINQLPGKTTIPAETAKESLISASALVRKQGSLLARPIVSFLRHEMLKGRTATELSAALQMSFSAEDLAKTSSEWKPLLEEVGLYGVVYSTQNSFEDCRDGADFLAKNASSVRAIVAGKKCESCIYNKVGRCLMYGRSLVGSVSEVFTWPVVEAVLLEHKNAGRLPPWEKVATLEASDPRHALKSIHGRVHQSSGLPQQISGVGGRMDVFHQWVGASSPHVAGGQVKKEILRTARRHLNEGLYGLDLLRLMRSKFEIRDLKAAQGELKLVLAEQGLQGIYFVDPTVYEDYGRGCDEASRLFRARQVPYAKVGSKCGSCVHNNNQHCAKLAKPLVVDPPYVDKVEQQKAILASGPSTEISASSLMAPNGLSMMAEYQLQHNAFDIEIGSPVTSPPVELVIGRTRVKV